ncbi:MIP/aquaporin family protein [Streptomyces sp. VRA16 Mangrove soil]|uniref:MIP/aquaporin family protein n=1 Tax=Streptomyces sp. VRA16 Mangrove soil TaxID=2817434 RepID=UPI001A9CD57F|nr:aquaporin [Streptomyces sp. VRA16 Mangrove soil]MBO1334383.1 aquaporin [Streptomyces sp. VRA16 Mangrove soil]
MSAADTPGPPTARAAERPEPPAAIARWVVRGRPLSSYLAEALGSAWLVLAALTAVSFTMRADGGYLSAWPLTARLAVVGASVGGAVAVFSLTPPGKESGAHLNPAVSLFMTLRGVLSVTDLIAYTVFQLAGSVLGVLLARTLWGERVTAVNDGLIQPGLGWDRPGVVVIGELLSTAALLGVLAVMTSRPRPRSTPWVLALVIATLITSTGSRTGASFNPARNFGPHVVSGEYHLFWAYMLAPLAAAVVAAGALALLGVRRAWTHRVCCTYDSHRYHLLAPLPRQPRPPSSSR